MTNQSTTHLPITEDYARFMVTFHAWFDMIKILIPATPSATDPLTTVYDFFNGYGEAKPGALAMPGSASSSLSLSSSSSSSSSSHGPDIAEVMGAKPIPRLPEQVIVFLSALYEHLNSQRLVTLGLSLHPSTKVLLDSFFKPMHTCLMSLEDGKPSILNIKTIETTMEQAINATAELCQNDSISSLLMNMLNQEASSLFFTPVPPESSKLLADTDTAASGMPLNEIMQAQIQDVLTKKNSDFALIAANAELIGDINNASGNSKLIHKIIHSSAFKWWKNGGHLVNYLLTSLLYSADTLYLFAVGSNKQNIAVLAEALTGHPSLTSLDLSNNDIDEEEVVALAAAIQNIHTLTAIGLRDNDFGTKGLNRLAEALKDKHLTLIDLAKNFIDDERAAVLAELLMGNKTLTSLDLSTNQISEKGLEKLAAALKDAPITLLDLSDNNIGKDGTTTVAKVLESNQTLTELFLASNKIGDGGATAIAEVLPSNQTLMSLDLSENEIGAKGADDLATALKHNQALTALYLSRNELGKDGAIAIAKVLESNQTPTLGHASDNNTRAEETEELTITPAHNQTLTLLDLSENDIDDEGASALARELTHNPTLISFDLSVNGIGDEGIKHLATALMHNRALRSLNLSWNQIGAEGIKDLATALTHNQALTSLDLSSTYISDEEVKDLAAALMHNQVLTSLDLSDNNISEEGAKALADMLEHYNGTLTTLDFDPEEVSEATCARIEASLARNRDNQSLKAQKLVDVSLHACTSRFFQPVKTSSLSGGSLSALTVSAA